jgi:site-specific recombinase XerC
MEPPYVPEPETLVVSDDQLKALFKGCAGKEFDDIRDTAMIRLFFDSGVRLAELTNLRTQDVEAMGGVAVVVGEGRRPERVRSAPRLLEPSTSTGGSLLRSALLLDTVVVSRRSRSFEKPPGAS